MTEKDLIELINIIKRQKCEKQYVEIKKSLDGTTKKLYDTFSSFSNQNNGGTIVFGIDEKAGYEVTGVYDAQDLQVQVKNAAEQMEPVVLPFFTVAEYEGKVVVSAEIPECEPGSKPCFYKPAGRLRGSYVRVGDADMPMTEYEIYSYEVYKKKIRDELRVIDRASKSDFNRDKLNLFFAKLRNEKPQLATQTEQRILQLQGMTDQDKPTVAGLMLVGDYPQAFFPQLGITAMAVDGYEIGELGELGERFIDNKRFDGTIPEMLDAAMSFVRRNIKTAVIVDENGKRTDKPEYPLVAVRELILNALIHRDYSIHTEDSPIRVIIYRDKLVVENPGGLYGRLTITDLGKVPGDTRNPFIASNLEIIINTENRFSGIPTIRNEMKKAGLPEPLFENYRGNFRATLFSSSKAGAKNEAGDMTVEDKILRFCTEPKSKEDIAEMLDIKTPYYVVSRYINPLICAEKLAMTLPEKPKSKFQKFYTII
ncbi:MAG: putative DNA binding domain-containing protein [Lachnospiraceae bacterium]|nr:putative DNA binding domain-containing protein [Lachnospiraceae bacterium]